VGTLSGHTGANAAYPGRLSDRPVGGEGLPGGQASVWVRRVPMLETGNVQVSLRVHSGGPTGQIISVIGRDQR
jgi:hypothetical protein